MNPMRTLSALFAALVVGWPATGTLARPLSMLDVPELVKGADLIIVGRAHEEVSGRGTAARAQDQAFSISSDHVLKGEFKGRTVMVRQSAVRGDAVRVGDGRYGIFFLRRGDEPSTEFALLDPDHPALAAVPGRNAGTAAETALERVASVLIAVLGSPPNTLATMQEAISGHLRANDRSGGRSRSHADIAYAETANALSTIPIEMVRDDLERLVRAEQPGTALWAAHCLVRQGDAPTERILAVLFNPPTDIESSLSDFASALESGSETAAAAKEGGLRSRHAVPAMARLLKSSNVEIRRAAAYVLRGIGTHDVIRPLSPALSDPDPEIRYYAVDAIYTVRGAPGAPSAARFKRTEADYTRNAAILAAQEN